MPSPAVLTPAQQRVMTELMAQGQTRPHFDTGLADAIRGELEKALNPVAEALGPSGPSERGTQGPSGPSERETQGPRSETHGPEHDLWVDKRALGQVHACEAHYHADLDQPFEWNPATARGTVVHKALELSIGARGDPAPLDLVDGAVDRLTADDRRTGPGAYLSAAPELELGELRARAADMVVKFLECWPPLNPAWSPRTETGIGAELCGGRIVLWGKVDLALGVARGSEARVLIVDLKSGRSYGGHLDDLRFYALVQTLRVGIPPFRVASYYLDTATFHHEDVTVETLETAVRRTIDGTRRIAELKAGSRPGAISPGPTCNYCRLNPTCDGARQWRAMRPDGEA